MQVTGQRQNVPLIPAVAWTAQPAQPGRRRLEEEEEEEEACGSQSGTQSQGGKHTQPPPARHPGRPRGLSQAWIQAPLSDPQDSELGPVSRGAGSSRLSPSHAANSYLRDQWFHSLQWKAVTARREPQRVRSVPPALGSVF
ncbi:hypothetical protein J1605_006828 [Eschrichtius robustus]|uniref:Uncharacterized protein n=1 Tax=Eschrichtius robustus TaxID=9764 RepID=A0AB34H0L7_ESCRO|nr:hypothetical protein J1605_006828 [Eschrichtius robustus]